MGCLKLTYYPETELKTVNEKKELTTKISSKTLRSFYLFGFNGKENDNEVKGAGNSLDFGARIYDSRLGRWLSTDRLEYKHPDVSSYNYAGNSPIVIIDEDGDDIKIYYAGVKQKDGTTKFKVYSFKGNVNDKNIPKDQFVAKFIEAYKYNTENGGGDKLKEAAANKSIEVKLLETDGANQAENTSVYWNPQQGGMTSEGVVNSPSTVLEEEVDHALDAALNIRAHYNRASKPDAKWGNKEEKRVHGPGGSQEKTGKANREFKKGYTRRNYNGSIPVVVVGGVKSSKVDKSKTLKYLEKQENDAGGNYEGKQKQTINNYIKK